MTKIEFVYTHTKKSMVTDIVERFLNLAKALVKPVILLQTDGERSLGSKFDQLTMLALPAHLDLNEEDMHRIYRYRDNFSTAANNCQTDSRLGDSGQLKKNSCGDRQ